MTFPAGTGVPLISSGRRLESAEPTIAPEPPFQQVVHILRRRKRLIIAIAAGGTLLAGLGGLLIPPRYTAKAEIVVEPQVPAPVIGQVVSLAPEQDASAVQTQVAALTSRAHLERVLDSLAHDTEVKPRPKASTQDGYGRMWIRLGAQMREWLSGMATPALTALSRLSWTGNASEPTNDRGERSVESFERRLKVFQERNSHVVAIGFTSTDPDWAALAANRMAQLYVQAQYEQKRENTNRTLAWLSGRIAELKGELERSEPMLQQYRIEHGLAEVNRTDVVEQTLADLNRQLTAAESDLGGRQKRLEHVRELQQRGSETDTLADTLASPTLRELRRQEVELLQSKAVLAATFSALHPKTQAVAAQLQEVRRKVGREVDQAARDLENDTSVAEAQVRSIRDRLARVQGTSREARGAEVRLRELERQAAASRQLYEALLQRREQLREQQEMISPDSRILSLAASPDRPSSLNPILFMLPALIASTIGGGLLAVAKERLDRGLRSARDLDEVLEIPCIGLVPLVRLAAGTRPHHALLKTPFAPYTEAIRSLVATLQLSEARRTPKVILVTSSVPKEGKTTLAVSFATYAALLGQRVVLVDFDWRSPSVLREIGGEIGSSVLDLRDYGLSTAAVHKVPSLGLDCLPVRSRPDDPLSPFAGGQLLRLVHKLRGSYDCIVIDGPPLLAVTEARLLAALADRILFVVKWGSTRLDLAQNALNLLRRFPRLVGGDCLSIASGVVTQVDLNKHAQYRYGDVAETYARYGQYS